MNLIIEKGLKDSLKPEITLLNQNLEELARASDGFLGNLLSYVLINSGKRVRPALVILGARLGDVDAEKMRTVEKAVELIHIATLVHDDVIDQSALRRGQKTVYQDQGVDTAVLLGDHIYTKAFQLVAELGIPSILKILAESTSVMCAGEIDQLKNRYQFNISEKDYFTFIRKKTAVLFGASARSGAILSGQDYDIQKALESFGVNLGMAFQITDDLLDLMGEETVVGKTLRTDLANGKMTLPLIHYRDQIKNEKDRISFIESLKNPNGHLDDLIEKIKITESIEYSEKVASRHIVNALEDLSILPPSATRDNFTALAEMLWKRRS